MSFLRIEPCKGVHFTRINTIHLLVCLKTIHKGSKIYNKIKAFLILKITTKSP